MLYDVTVAGAGPAGFFAALSAASLGAKVLLLERMGSPGRKLLASGSGQCNLTHGGAPADFFSHYGSKEAARFLRPALYGFSNNDLIAFFVDRGVDLEETETGKVFPRSRSARDILHVLKADALGAGVVLRTEARVARIRRGESGFGIDVERGGPSTEEYRCRTMVLATGGASYPGTGSSGDGFRLAASLGHSVAETAPALTPFYIEPVFFAPFADCAGIALRDCGVLLFRAGRKVASGKGDVLFTHRGLSGPGILDASRAAAAGDEVRLVPVADFPDAEAADRRLLRELEEHGARSSLRVLQGFGLPEALCRALLDSVGAEASAKAASLSKGARRALAQGLSSCGGFPFPVERLGGWKEAMATRGGVALPEIDPKTMESRVVPGLYFAGEVMDIDGDTGGYNIQAACSTGRLAGLSAAGRLGFPG